MVLLDEELESMRISSITGVHSVLRIVVVVLAAGPFLACSSSTPAPGAGDTATGATGGTSPGAVTPPVSGKSPCLLLVRADAEAAVGQPLPKNDENDVLGTCGYNSDDFSSGAALTVGTWDSIKAAATSGPTQPSVIAGVGDDALNLNGSNGSLLYVRKGSQGFLLVLNGPNIDSLADHGLAQEKILAAKVLANF
jgi:hypothetical protein